MKELLAQADLIAAFWVALAVFIIAVTAELWSRHKHIQKERHKRHHPDRIHKGLAYVRQHNIKKITNDLWEEITGVSHATATRDFDKMQEMGIIKEKGRGKGTYYVPVKKKQ